MHDITIDLEIEGKDEHLDFQLCVQLILVSLSSSLRCDIMSALKSREILLIPLTFVQCTTSDRPNFALCCVIKNE